MTEKSFFFGCIGGFAFPSTTSTVYILAFDNILYENMSCFLLYYGKIFTREGLKILLVTYHEGTEE